MNYLSRCNRLFVSTGRIIGLSGYVTIATLSSPVLLPVNAEVAPAATASSTQTNPDVLSLARYLKQIGAKMYGAYWCPHCQHQKDLFGTTAFKLYVNYIECDPRGYKPNPDLCREKKIMGYPTWEIKGQLYPGVQSLDELANLAGYKGSRNF